MMFPIVKEQAVELFKSEETPSIDLNNNKQINFDVCALLIESSIIPLIFIEKEFPQEIALMRKSSLSFLFALVFGLLGAALPISDALYINNKIFLSWLLMYLRNDNQWFFPIFFWAIASLFLSSGITGRRRITSSRPIQFRNDEKDLDSFSCQPAIRLWLGISILGASFVFLCCFCLCSDPLTLEEGERAFFYGEHAVVYEDSLSYQGHVYLLSVENGEEEYNFEVSQCDASGWFCHVIYDIPRRIDTDLDVPWGSNLIEAHLQADAPHHHLFILYHSNVSDLGKLLCPIPPS